MAYQDDHCRHCQARIVSAAGTWVHVGTGSVYCDQSGTTRAAR